MVFRFVVMSIFKAHVEGQLKVNIAFQETYLVLGNIKNLQLEELLVMFKGIFQILFKHCLPIRRILVCLFYCLLEQKLINVLDYFLFLYPLCFNYIGFYMYKLKVIYTYIYIIYGLRRKLGYKKKRNHYNEAMLKIMKIMSFKSLGG